MQTLFNSLLALHVIGGALALLLMWVPALSRKGSNPHKRFGRYYHHCMITVAVAGLLMSGLTLLVPDSARADTLATSADPERTRRQLQVMNLLLLHLALLVFRSVRHGRLALECKHDRSALRRWPEVTGTLLLLLTGLLVAVTGMKKGLILMMVFGPLGALIATSMLWFTFKAEMGPREWLTEHLGGYIGSAIGAITAFFSFGGRALFDGSGNLQLMLWIAPGVLGGALIFWLTRRYSRAGLS